MENKRVLFLLHIPPPVHGSSMVGQYIKKSKLINDKFTSRYINLLASREVSNSGKASMKKLLGFLLLCYKLLKELIVYRPKLCYLALTTTGFAFYRDVVLVALIRLFRIKRIYHIHNKGIALHDRFWIHRTLYEFVFKGAEVILLSKYLYSDVEAYVCKKNIYICANGIPEEINGLESKFRLEENMVKVLFLSNLIESKGVYVLLEACRVLQEQGVRFCVDFIGGEGDVSEKQFDLKVKELGLDEVRYLGKKYGADKIAAFEEADLFAFPTYYPNECFPLVLLEAMQHSLPVVSTFEGGIADIVEDSKTGFLVSQGSVEDFAMKLKILIQDKNLRTTMGEAGRKRYRKNFRLNIFEKKLTQIIEEVLIIKES